MKRNIFNLLMLAVLPILAAGCVDNEPTVEELPRDAVSFEYCIVGEYPLDYYVDSEIQFTNTSPSTTTGSPEWDFGDGNKGTGNTVDHAYPVAGTYNVTLTIGDKKKTQVIMISDIKPLLTINPIEGGVCEVNTSKVSFTLEVPNPGNRSLEYLWTFPAGTKNANGEDYPSSTQEDPWRKVSPTYRLVSTRTFRPCTTPCKAVISWR